MATSGSLSSAVQLLKRAVEFDQKGNYPEAFTCYDEGIKLLLQASSEESNAAKKKHFIDKVRQYLTRAEELKVLKKEQQALREHTEWSIPEGATGYGYGKVFGNYMDSNLTKVEIKDPYIRSVGQLYNLQRFVETLVQYAPNISSVSLLTSRDDNKQREIQQQSEGLLEMQQALAARNIEFSYDFSETLHDREIKFNNGWKFTLGRGLDYFQRLQGGRFALGCGDYDLRPCKETKINIYHSSVVSTPR